MIIIKLQGGLGNQLFQYALGRTLEKVYKKDVKYDLSFYTNNKKFTPRSYFLDKFNTKVKIASDVEIKNTRPLFAYTIKKLLNKLFYKKYHIAYESGFLESIKGKDSIYLEGYWHSYRYVEPCLNNLKMEIILIDDKVSGTLKGESIAVHIRRGDYLNKSGNLNILDTSYYKEAVGVILKKVENPHYYIFTDDTAWVKANISFFKKGEITYVSEFGLEDYEEFSLMTQCKNVIIANSSFSWWGAMLNQNKEGTIICPKDWKNIYLKNDENLCPKEWIRV